MSEEYFLHNIPDQMVKISGGEIQLRDEKTNRRWKVDIKPFLLLRYPITQALYNEITEESPSGSKGDFKPVENVSWKDAISFCNNLSKMAGLKECYTMSEKSENIICNWDTDGFRLPNEAEWEFACRAGTKTDRYGEIDKIAWYNENSGKESHEVGKKEPNEWGLYDMIGNVWEWCWDIFDPKVYGPYRVFRGGGWSDPPIGCRASSRRKSHPTFRIDDLGFRIARTS